MTFHAKYCIILDIISDAGECVDMILYEAYNLDASNPYTMFDVHDLIWELHFHRAYECVFVCSGEICCRIEHETYHAKPGMLLFVMPNQLHSLTTSGTSHCYILRFSPELIGHFHNSYLDRIPRDSCFAFRSSEDIINFYLSQKAKPRNIYVLKALLYKICGELVEHTDFLYRRNSSKDLLIYSLLDYIHKHYTGKCSLRTAAEDCCCDYYYASKTFIKYTGISFVDYVNNLRVQKACYLIKNTNDTCMDIALNCGFTSLRSFNRNFLKYCRCTPSEYAHANHA